MLKLVLQILLMATPWPIRRRLLNRVFGFRIAPTARVGLSIIGCRNVEVGDGAVIGHFNSFRNMSRLEIEPGVVIGNFNWFSATGENHPVHYRDQPGRDPSLVIRTYASISSRHHFDCTDRIDVGAFTTIAGGNTQVLTHGVDVNTNRQMCGPVRIGAYCFVGTRSIFLMNTSLPNNSVLAAGAVVAKKLTGDYSLFGGVPAMRIKDLPKDALYFSRPTGIVV